MKTKRDYIDKDEEPTLNYYSTNELAAMAEYRANTTDTKEDGHLLMALAYRLRNPLNDTH